jgi:hypothetical protein
MPGQKYSRPFGNNLDMTNYCDCISIRKMLQAFQASTFNSRNVSTKTVPNLNENNSRAHPLHKHEPILVFNN